MRLLVLGPGYSARAVLARLAPRLASVVATARSPEAAASLEARGITPIPFDGTAPSPALAAALAAADHLLVSIPPDEAGDPVLRHHGAEVEAAARAGQLRWFGYLSTVGVYGDHGGALVDEATAPRPVSARSRRRVEAEGAWAGLGSDTGVPAAILRLAGIYGPGRNPFVALAAGTARRIVKPGQVFNRIHVDDIAAAVEAAADARFAGALNVTDDEPGPPQDVVAFAAGLMGVVPPPETPFETAELTAMARSFYGENKRVSNRRLRVGLGVDLAFPTYREGLTALWRSGRWRG